MKNNEFIIKFSTKFKGIRVIDTEMYSTEWSLVTDIVPNPKASDEDFNFALNKIKFWLEQILEGSVMFSSNNKWAVSSFMSKASNVSVLCPHEPTDDHLNTLFVSKINALGTGILTAGFLELTSDTSAGLTFIYVGDDAPYMPTMKEWIGKRSYFAEPWWDRNDASSIDVVPKRGVDLTDTPAFAVNLDFLREHLPIEEDESKVIRPSKFKPKVIDGKKKD